MTDTPDTPESEKILQRRRKAEEAIRQRQEYEARQALWEQTQHGEPTPAQMAELRVIADLFFPKKGNESSEMNTEQDVP